MWEARSAAVNGTRSHLGVLLLWTHGPAAVTAEMITGSDLSVRRVGYYAHVSHKVHPKADVPLRVGTWDPDRHLAAVGGVIRCRSQSPHIPSLRVSVTRR